MAAVGSTRCYWALLSPSLEFLYLDPVLQTHLSNAEGAGGKAAAEVLLGRSLLDFVHPDEQGTAKTDLGNVLDSKTLHGSVTRVRFARLDKLRAALGAGPAPAAWSAAVPAGGDADYMPVDVVINWAADGLVLCFIHAMRTDDPPASDDPPKPAPWGSCDTPELSEAQVRMMYSRLLVCGGEGGPSAGAGGRVFQILAQNAQKTHLISWPPVDHRHLTRLAHEINVDTLNPSDAKTSCTRRFKAANFNTDIGAHVESVFIPHGSIIFACHKVEPPNLMSPSYDYYAPNSHSYSYQPPPPAWSRPSGPYYDGAPPPPPGPYTGYDAHYPIPQPDDEVPPTRRRSSPSDHQTPSPTSQSAQSSSGRGNRPAGILKCTSCKATTSPEWRKGPSGRKELCNACGLRYARSRAKKEGGPKSARGGKVRSSTSVAAMRREGSASSSSGAKTEADSSLDPGAPYAGPGPSPTYDYYRGRDEEPAARFADSPSQPSPSSRNGNGNVPPPYERPPYAAAGESSRAYPPEGDRYYHPSPLASYERRRD